LPGVRGVVARKKVGDDVNYAGEPIVAVAAETLEVAEEAVSWLK